jgi:serine/threonine-protein kinase
MISSSSGPHGRFEPGTRLGTRYRVVGLLGRGGMGEVYRADDLELGQAVALKFLPPALAGNATELARFRGEVRVARQIAHPNICRVYDIGEADGHVFLSMEYIDGEDLASVLRRMGRPSSDKALEIARQICLGLAAAHDAGMLHRDLKPANIMIDGRGRVRITDFGLAGLADELTREGGIAGTPAYMAPEQLTGGRVSVRSDVYALGLVLYEVFTGKRAFPATSVAELKQMHESSSLTTPSDLVRDLDPAVEHVVLRCLERDPEQRPPSAYAVLGGLPGGDPLAAVLAAGETPSPELVANAGGRGSLSPLTAIACVAAGLIGIGIWAGVVGVDYRVLTRPTQVLSVRADDILARTGSFSPLPRHTAEGFDVNTTHLKYFLRGNARHEEGVRTVFFWRRWSPRRMEAADIHTVIAGPGDPPLGTGQATVLLDPAGRLLALEAIPPDSAVASGGKPDWLVLFEAAGLDPASFSPAQLAQPAPAICDTTAAWTGRLPGSGSDKVTVQAGASRGRLVYFSMIHNWGASTAPLDAPPAASAGPIGWLALLIVALPLAGSIYFAGRNLKLGRGDRKGATRIALFVFTMNMLIAMFSTRLSEEGLLAASSNWVFGRAFAHSLMHAMSMWFAYVAIEPYLRRLWPRLLVSWARLISGRPRDPLVGRDLLVGALAGTALTALASVIQYAGSRFGFANLPPSISATVASLSLTGLQLAVSGSVCLIYTLNVFVMVLVLRLLLQRTWPAVLISVLLISGTFSLQNAPTSGWLVAVLLGGVFIPGLILTIMRFGLLAGATAMFVLFTMSSATGTLDLSSWYASRALVPMVVLAAILIYGAATALGGKPIFGDPLREAPAR